MSNRKCSVQGCDNKYHGHGFCGRHAMRFKRHGDPLAGGTSFNEPLEFLKSAVVRAKTGENACIVWPYSIANVYGELTFNGKRWKAHRLALVLSGVDNKPELFCCHDPAICNNPPCVNANHLRFATAKDNAADKIIAGTATRGEAHAGSKLTETDVRAIRADTRTRYAIAKHYGVSWGLINMIIKRKRWGWLD